MRHAPRPRRQTSAVAATALIGVLACGTEVIRPGADLPALDLRSVSTQEWIRLGERRVYFGHQSVGAGLIAGVADVLAAHPEIALRVVEVTAAGDMAEPALYHGPIGENGRPDTKTSAFVRLVSRSLDGPGVAMLKYCYVDVKADTDPDAMFEAYRTAADSLRAANPELTIVHFTLPLWVDNGLWFHVRTVVRGRTSHRELNLFRERYNARLRATYGGREPVFDLALLESTGPDGGRTVVRFRGERVPVLAPRWTDDGGHLNVAGRRRMAEALLATLAKL